MNNNKINEFFEKEKIEYYAILDYNDLHQINPRIIERKNIEAKSVIIFLIPYYAGETVNLSKYAAAKDYHLYIKGITERLIQFLRAEYPENSFFGFGGVGGGGQFDGKEIEFAGDNIFCFVGSHVFFQCLLINFDQLFKIGGVDLE